MRIGSIQLGIGIAISGLVCQRNVESSPLLYNCLWVFYAPPGSAGWKESTLHHVMYASKLREIKCLLPQNLPSALYRGKIVFLLLEAGHTALLPVISDLGVIWSQVSGEGVVLDDTVFIQVRDL